MAVSVFDLFKVGVGPSSSHTVGPMRAARLFSLRLNHEGVLNQVQRVRCQLHGSLGLTGRGHASDIAVMLGLDGYEPDSVDVDAIPAITANIHQTKQVKLLGIHPVDFDPEVDILLIHQALRCHANGLIFEAIDAGGRLMDRCTYYSVGGGFVVSEELLQDELRFKSVAPSTTVLPIPFSSARELLMQCRAHNKSIAEIMMINEMHWRSDEEVRQGLLSVWRVMRACIERGCEKTGQLPGGFKVPRRAAALYQKLLEKSNEANKDPLLVIDWVNLYALAVNEENASGGRVVTAPTNGAAGIIPAVLNYYVNFIQNANEDGVVEFLLTAAAIGILYKENASISGAEVGCQGEVGVACSMAAGALCAVLGGSNEQVENAAEIGMEHHLGLTCDPVGGLVQIPCIERNAIASVKAINAARMALRGDGLHIVSLDQVIKTMRETGRDMASKYKETSQGGLAVNIIAC